MINLVSRPVSEELNRRHAFVAAGAVALSAVLHVGLLFYLSGIQFGFPIEPGRKLREEFERTKPLKLVDVRKEAPTPERPRPPASKLGDTVAPFDLSKEAESKGVQPDKVAIQPPPVTEAMLAGEKDSLAQPTPAPRLAEWNSRQEILQVEKRVASDGAGELRRVNLPRVERVSDAPDVALPVDSGKIGAAGILAATNAAGDEPGRSDITQVAMGGVVSDSPEMLIGRGRAGGGGPRGLEPGLKIENATNATPYKPIEKYLAVDVYVYSSMFDPKYEYVRLEIKRAGSDLLPVIPKDVVLVQDSSNSMAEQRLHFCREGLVRCLAELGPADRVNVIRFRESAETCFDDWVENKPENIERASRFIGEMQSTGNTDILASIKNLLNLKRIPGRPVVALIVTDGRSTTGTMGSSDIIGEFSKINDGAISAFTLGTLQTAETYLLDLLSYCNRGDSAVVTTGRWDIPDAIQKFAREFSRPVLSEVRFRFARGTGAEVYPVLTGNLYLDRPLVLYGRQPKGTKKLVFQAIGKAVDVNCDMVFDLDLEKIAKYGDRETKEKWAEQKIYCLIGEYARNPEPKIMEQITETARSYKIEIPYKGRF